MRAKTPSRPISYKSQARAWKAPSYGYEAIANPFGRSSGRTFTYSGRASAGASAFSFNSTTAVAIFCLGR